ncbi:UPF0598 protein CG30010-like [Tubulanus polymorphus]|uniref:UPF0598 protein CG30010-like n=1 Tax=Tubulanus polymorphus TaxID=672921 RepID=UPI003DA69164
MSSMSSVKYHLPILVRRVKDKCFQYVRCVHYVQGQSPKPNIREYFYYIDHHGQLFLDDARMKNFTSCFKEKKFLEFFFHRLKFNDTDRYKDFPYLSPCGREKNYIRCDDLPIVFTHVIPDQQDRANDLFSYGYAGELLTVPFEPQKICMLPESGRIYHPGPDKLGGVGLVRSSLAIEFSKLFTFEDDKEHEPPTKFLWNDINYDLTNELVNVIRNFSRKAES